MNWYLTVLKKYAVFSGRARRKEYWMFFLFQMIFVSFAIILDRAFGLSNTFGHGPIYILYALAMFIPGLAVSVRRLHDVGKSGWMSLIVLIPEILYYLSLFKVIFLESSMLIILGITMFGGGIWLFVLSVTDSNPGENQYGKNPKEEQENSTIAPSN